LPISRALRALRHRNYRLFFGGQSLSLVGTWITRIATSWLVYRLTGSAFLLGLVGFCGQIPTLVLTPFAGVIVDRSGRHRILVITQALSLLQSAALAALAFPGLLTVPWILALNIVQGIINAFDTPARQSFVVEMIEDRDDLGNAIALNSTMVNGARIIGPSIGGALIALFGEAWCFTVDAISYLAVLASLFAMRLTPLARETRNTRMIDDLTQGVRYVTRFPPIRALLTLLAIVSTMGMPYSVLMPAIARTVLRGGAHTLGFLMTASGVGAVVGALYLASRSTVLGLVRVLTVATLVFGASLVAFSLSRSVTLSLLILPFVGGGMMIETAATNTILQTLVSEEMRGRVMSFYTMAFLGTLPIGSLLAGVLAARAGAPAAIFVGGVACVVAGIVFATRLPRLRELVRPVYVEKGIIGEGLGPRA
jgi:MFS family permease